MWINTLYLKPSEVKAPQEVNEPRIEEGILLSWEDDHVVCSVELFNFGFADGFIVPYVVNETDMIAPCWTRKGEGLLLPFQEGVFDRLEMCG